MSIFQFQKKNKHKPLIDVKRIQTKIKDGLEMR